MGKSDLGWLKSIFHFSFAEYHNPKNINFGVLRVINDDLIAENTGFPLHPHKDMEIITYVVDGEVTHTDSIGNESVIRRGEVQYMSAGTGIYHSEANNSSTEVLRALQIWILPDFRNHAPNYGEYRFEWLDRKNNFLHMVSSKSGTAPIKINQDINIYTIFLEKGLNEEFQVTKGRQAYYVQIEGEADVNGEKLYQSDALESISENLQIDAKTGSHIMIFEMAEREDLK
jgi:redox-sensitive bicupin YhaK (pirin superfamily)